MADRLAIQVPDRPHCPTCDKPVAADVDWEHARNCKSRTCNEGEDLCWGGSLCKQDAVDWRARALAAEAKLHRMDEQDPTP